MAISIEQMQMGYYQREQEEMLRQRYLEDQRRMMDSSSAYYDINRNAFLVPHSQEAAKEAPKLVPARAADPLAFIDNQANRVLLTQGEI